MAWCWTDNQRTIDGQSTYRSPPHRLSVQLIGGSWRLSHSFLSTSSLIRQPRLRHMRSSRVLDAPSQQFGKAVMTVVRRWRRAAALAATSELQAPGLSIQRSSPRSVATSGGPCYEQLTECQRRRRTKLKSLIKSMNNVCWPTDNHRTIRETKRGNDVRVAAATSAPSDASSSASSAASPPLPPPPPSWPRCQCHSARVAPRASSC